MARPSVQPQAAANRANVELPQQLEEQKPTVDDQDLGIQEEEEEEPSASANVLNDPSANPDELEPGDRPVQLTEEQERALVTQVALQGGRKWFENKFKVKKLANLLATGRKHKIWQRIIEACQKEAKLT